MRNVLKSLVTHWLAFVARRVVKRYRPTVVMVTGSVGKTSTKDAVAKVLETRFLVRKSDKSQNSEFGVPFTILGVKNPWKNPVHWISVCKRAFALLVLPNHYPNLLVLEVGADRPGDLAKIMKIVTPDALVVTRLPEIPVHVEAYASPEAVREEEFSPAYALKPSAPLIVCADDLYAMEMALRTSARTVSYGFSKEAEVRITHPDFFVEDRRVAGMTGTVVRGEEQGTLTVRGSVGIVQLFPPTAAIATATAFGIPLAEALEAMRTFKTPPGRCRILSGSNGSVLIDDTYNASPVATEAALDVLARFPHAKRRIAILGDMLELGRYSVMEHERIGLVAQQSSDLLITVGVRARSFAAGADVSKAHSFDSSEEAANALHDLPQEGDVILIKGSQGARMERIVKVFLASPHDAENMVRQDKEWLRRP